MICPHLEVVKAVDHPLHAASNEHRRCSDLDGGVEDYRAWTTCSFGAVLVRVVAFS